MTVFVPETPEEAACLPEKSCGAVEESPGMTPVSPDSVYVSRPMEPDASQWTVHPPSEYQTPSRGASSSTLAPSPTIERADKSEQLTKKDRRTSASHMEQHRGRTSQGSGYDVKKATAPEGRLGQHIRSVRQKNSSTDDEQVARSPRASSRRSRSSRIMRSSQRAESSSSSSSESSIHDHTRPKHILKPPKYDGAGSFEMFLAHFRNCASYNKWTKREQLVYLRSSLEKLSLIHI